jgi:hypothetical protein
MKKIFYLIIILSVCNKMHAQQHFKLSTTHGIGRDTKVKNDSLFFAGKCNATQIRAGYHYGKLGLIFNNTIIRQRATPLNAIDEREPIFVSQAERTISDVQTINSTLGLELCVPFAKRKMQLNLYAAYGLSISKSDSVKFVTGTPIEVLYSHKVNRKTTGCWQAGFSLNYKLNRHFALKWQNEFDYYKLPFNALDTRKTPAIFTGNQVKNIFISSVGAQYTF